jgi:S1-C subfamily serine protease
LGDIQSLPLRTGFLLNQDAFVVAAKHVLDGARQVAAEVPSLRLCVGLAHGNTENLRTNFTLVGFELIAERERHDLALLRLTQNPFRGDLGISGPYARRRTARSPGAMLASTGYPPTNAVLITSVGHVASPCGSA